LFQGDRALVTGLGADYLGFQIHDPRMHVLPVATFNGIGFDRDSTPLSTFLNLGGQRHNMIAPRNQGRAKVFELTTEVLMNQ
jgi:hypothetical protein